MWWLKWKSRRGICDYFSFSFFVWNIFKNTSGHPKTLVHKRVFFSNDNVFRVIFISFIYLFPFRWKQNQLEKKFVWRNKPSRKSISNHAIDRPRHGRMRAFDQNVSLLHCIHIYVFLSRQANGQLPECVRTKKKRNHSKRNKEEVTTKCMILILNDLLMIAFSWRCVTGRM